MRRTRACRPAVQNLEERVVLSLSLSGFFNSLFPFLKKNDPAPRRAHPAVSTVAPATASTSAAAARHASALAAAQAQQAAIAAARANAAANRALRFVPANPNLTPGAGLSPATADTATPGHVTMYGPFLGRPGTLRRLPLSALKPQA